MVYWKLRTKGEKARKKGGNCGKRQDMAKLGCRKEMLVDITI